MVFREFGERRVVTRLAWKASGTGYWNWGLVDLVQFVVFLVADKIHLFLVKETLRMQPSPVYRGLLFVWCLRSLTLLFGVCGILGRNDRKAVWFLIVYIRKETPRTRRTRVYVITGTESGNFPERARFPWSRTWDDRF